MIKIRQHKSEKRNLFLVTLLNFIISAAEIAGGIFSNSLSLISDAFHNIGDGLAVLIAYIAVKVSKKDSDYKKTFGYKRIQILAALFNSVVLIVISIYLIYKAYNRFIDPEPVKSLPMIIVAFIGLAANIISVFLLRKYSKGNLNIKSAYLHLISDTLSSFSVIIGGILIYFFKVFWIDPLITVIISIYLIKETIKILLETFNILMQAAPKNINIPDIQKKLTEIPEIKGIHHVHIWKLSDKDILFEAHVDLINDFTVSESEIILHKAEELLNKEFGITHVTLQMEYDFCDDKNLIYKAY